MSTEDWNAIAEQASPDASPDDSPSMLTKSPISSARRHCEPVQRPIQSETQQRQERFANDDRWHVGMSFGSNVTMACGLVEVIVNRSACMDPGA